METNEDRSCKKCYKVKDCLYDSLNIVCNEYNSNFILFNRYQLLIYENFDFNNPAKEISPEFQVRQVINCNNYLICLDFTGNIHVTSLKFKNSAQKRFKSSFQPREQGVINCVQINKDAILSLKWEYDRYYLGVYQINNDFQLEAKFSLQCLSEHWPLPQISQEKCILLSQTINIEDFELLKNLFKIKEHTHGYSIIIISFDKICVYGCIFSPKFHEDEITLIKLYTCPSQICDIKIIKLDNLYLFIGLTIGTIVCVKLTDLAKESELIYLNTAISKFNVYSKNMLIYTDGLSMWKADNILSKHIKYTQFIIKHIKDFVKYGDQLICTTFTNLIYVLGIEDMLSYTKAVSVDEYCSAETVFNNSEYFYRTLKEIELGKEWNKKVIEEESYVTAIALSKRQDIMEKSIQCYVTVYESYDCAIQENTDITLTEQIKNYFEPGSLYILIKITASIIHHTFNEILSNIFGDMKIHVNILSEQKLLKTTSIRLKEILKKVQILIPLETKFMLDIYKLNVDIKLVTNIPGVLDKKQCLWIVLYRKFIELSSVHLIKTNAFSQKIKSLKEADGCINDLILKTACNHHAHLFHFSDTLKNKINLMKLHFYIKLPINYVEILKSQENYTKKFNKNKANYLFGQFTSDEFLKSKTDLNFDVANEKVQLTIVNDFGNLLLKVASDNIKIAFNIRNFLADFINGQFKNCNENMEFVNYTLYTNIENLKKSMKQCLVNGSESEFWNFAEQFQKNVIGGFPI